MEAIEQQAGGAPARGRPPRPRPSSTAGERVSPWARKKENQLNPNWVIAPTIASPWIR